MKKKHRKSIYQKLVFSYIVFALTAIVIVIGCLAAGVFFSIGKNVGEDFPGVSLDASGEPVNVSNITDMGGWVEQLDRDYHVVKVYGDKQTKEMEYTEYQLSTCTNIISSRDSDYHMFWQQEEPYSYLCCYPKELFNVTFNFDVNEIPTTDVEKTFLRVMFLFLFLDVFAVSYYIYRKIKRPLDVMIDGMEKVEQGDMDVLLDIHGEREFMTIQKAFHHMVKELEAKRLENEQLTKGRQQMLLELSHDIKTPVSTIKSYALALEQNMVPEEEQGKYYHVIAKKADRVNLLCDDLFTMLKMESEDYKLELKSLDIVELIRKICAEFYQEIVDGGFDLEIDLPEGQVMIEGDERLLSRVISNLLVNARKYNLSGHEIGISLKQAEHICIRVTDDGEPIDASIAETMFHPFVRGEHARSTSGGTGLGLAIAKGVAAKHGGNLTYTYEDGKNVFIIVIDKGNVV